jgi:hypothetical protein
LLEFFPMALKNGETLLIRNASNGGHHKQRNSFWLPRVNTKAPVASLHNFIEPLRTGICLLSYATGA